MHSDDMPGAPELHGFGDAHRKLRSECDGFTLEQANGPSLKLTRSTTATTLHLKTNDVIDRELSRDNVLVCFSLLDLGVEVVVVLEYGLETDDYLLDGEIVLGHKGAGERDVLVRQPIALFAHSYLQEMFGGQELGPDLYTEGVTPSIRVRRPPRPDEVRLFDWDIRKRMEVVAGRAEKATDWERERFLDWYDKFGGNFLDAQGAPTPANLPRLFVPATAKLLHQYFNSPRGDSRGS